MSIGVEDLGVFGVFGVPGVFSLELSIFFSLEFPVKLSFDSLMYPCSLYSALIHVDLNLIFNQYSSLALTKLFSLKQLLTLFLT